VTLNSSRTGADARNYILTGLSSALVLNISIAKEVTARLKIKNMETFFLGI
jgi:hypothetical protein